MPAIAEDAWPWPSPDCEATPAHHLRLDRCATAEHFGTTGIDETATTFPDIGAMTAAHRDQVEVVHLREQVVCAGGCGRIASPCARRPPAWAGGGPT